MNTWLLDESINKKRQKNEFQRKQLIKKVKNALNKLKEKINFDDVYIFGSIVKPYRFSDNSDIDICFSGLDNQNFFKAWAELTHELSLDNIQIVRIEDIPFNFKEKILKEGIKWKKK